jgi:rhomboid protease GluP
MLSLYNLGRMLEPFIGKWRFLILYLATGLAASVASMWWNPNSAAAGASGAIVGLVGVLGALVTTDLVDKRVRGSLLKSIGTSILLMVVIGLNGMVDNAGHFGGLIAGAIAGYLNYFDLKAWFYRRKKQFTFLLVTLGVLAGICIYLWTITPVTQDPNVYIKRFIDENNKALALYNTLSDSSPAEEVKSKAVIPFQRMAAVVDTFDRFSLSEEGERITDMINQYSEARLNAADVRYKGAVKKDQTLIDSAGKMMKRADEMETKLGRTLFKE